MTLMAIKQGDSNKYHGYHRCLLHKTFLNSDYFKSLTSDITMMVTLYLFMIE